MALIKCSECGREISDKATSCPGCGCPVSMMSDVTQRNTHCIINGQEVDCSFFFEEFKDIDNISDLLKCKEMCLMSVSNLGCDAAEKAIKEWSAQGCVPKIYDGETYEEEEERMSRRSARNSINTPKCPKCGSTAISTGARGVNNFWGFLGASQTVNRCANCGHTWKPRG